MNSEILSYNMYSNNDIDKLIMFLQSKFLTSSRWSFERINVTSIIPLCKHVYTERLDFAEKSISCCKNNNIPLFFPYVVHFKNGKQHLIVPPIVEERNGLLYLGDGMHRIYKLLEHNIPSAYVLITHDCTLPLPGNPQTWSTVEKATVQLPGHLNFDNFLREGLTGYSKFCNSNFFWT